ncbi:unnamed protein product, partial [Ixodes persulcatus]
MEDSTGPPIVPCSFKGSQANDCGDLEVWSESSFEEDCSAEMTEDCNVERGARPHAEEHQQGSCPPGNGHQPKLSTSKKLIQSEAQPGPSTSRKLLPPEEFQREILTRLTVLRIVQQQQGELLRALTVRQTRGELVENLQLLVSSPFDDVSSLKTFDSTIQVEIKKTLA